MGQAGKVPATVPKSTALSTWESTWSDQVDSPVDLAVDLAQTSIPGLVHLHWSLVLFWKLLTWFDGSDLS